MDNDFLASKSEKTTASPTPFDQIAQEEAVQKSRVEEAVRKYEEERKKTEIALEEKMEREEARMQEEARAELTAFRDGELQDILRSSEEETRKICTELEKNCARLLPAVTGEQTRILMEHLSGSLSS